MVIATAITFSSNFYIIFFLFLVSFTLPLLVQSRIESQLNVRIPHSLRKENGGYNHQISKFGFNPKEYYGRTITQYLYYANSTLCTSKMNNIHNGYPERPYNSDGIMEPYQYPFLLMVDRGDCTFVQKVRNAQHNGASGVIFADNTCLCSDVECIQNNPNMATCETRGPIIVDDGSSRDISIPSALLFKHDADLIKDQLINQNHPILFELSWPYNNMDNNMENSNYDEKVEYELWMLPIDIGLSINFLQYFQPIAKALSINYNTYFKPQIYIMDGIMYSCMQQQQQQDNPDHPCYNMCTNNGRYCSVVDDTTNLIYNMNGKDSVKEALRWMCIWKIYGNKESQIWFDYVTQFIFQCIDYTNNNVTTTNTITSSTTTTTTTTTAATNHNDDNDCIETIYKDINIDGNEVRKCMTDSGGTERDSPNSFFDLALDAKAVKSIIGTPTLIINDYKIQLDDTFTINNVFNAICDYGFVTTKQPQICAICTKCLNLIECIENDGICSTNEIIIKDNDMSTTESNGSNTVIEGGGGEEDVSWINDMIAENQNDNVEKEGNSSQDTEENSPDSFYIISHDDDDDENFDDDNYESEWTNLKMKKSSKYQSSSSSFWDGTVSNGTYVISIIVIIVLFGCYSIYIYKNVISKLRSEMQLQIQIEVKNILNDAGISNDDDVLCNKATTTIENDTDNPMIDQSKQKLLV